MQDLKEKKQIFRELVDFLEYFYQHQDLIIHAYWDKGVWRLSYRKGKQLTWDLFCQTPREAVETLWNSQKELTL